jgi:cobalt-zinc-cadmium resistance protein CzcA
MKIVLFAIFSACAWSAVAQGETFTIDEAVNAALKNNAGVRAAGFDVESQRQLKKTSFDLPKTDVMMMYGQYNSYHTDNNFTVLQSIPFTALGSQGALNRSNLRAAELQKASTENELAFQVKQIYYQLAYVYSRHQLFLEQDSIYEGFLKSATLRYKTGEANLLEETTAEVQRNESKNKLLQNEYEIVTLRSQLQSLLNSDELPDIEAKELTELKLEAFPDTLALGANPGLAFSNQQIDVAKHEKRLASAKLAPDLLIGFFSQTLIGTPNLETGTLAGSKVRFNGLQVGISLPLWFAPEQGRAKAAEFATLAAQTNYDHHQLSLKVQLNQARQLFMKTKNNIEYYRSTALPHAELILKQSQTAFQSGDIEYSEYLFGLRNSISIEEGYLETLNEYNQSVLLIEFLTGIK